MFKAKYIIFYHVGSSTTSSDSERFDFRVTDSYSHSFLGQPGFNLKPDIWHLWLDFVYSERIQAGLSTFMETPRGRGCCGLSRQSYPHWPPTTIQESFDQLVYLHKLVRKISFVPEEKQKNFASKTRACLFLGYVWNSKVMDVVTRHIFTTPSIKFDEYSFPGLPNNSVNRIFFHIESLSASSWPTSRTHSPTTEPRSPRTGHCQITVSTRPISWTSGGDYRMGGKEPGYMPTLTTPVKRKGGCLISPRRRSITAFAFLFFSPRSTQIFRGTTKK